VIGQMVSSVDVGDAHRQVGGVVVLVFGKLERQAGHVASSTANLDGRTKGSSARILPRHRAMVLLDRPMAGPLPAADSAMGSVEPMEGDSPTFAVAAGIVPNIRAGLEVQALLFPG